MKIIIFEILFFLLPTLTFGQSIQKQLNIGETVILEITPTGDRFTNPAWFHSYQIVKSNSDYVVILTKGHEIIKKIFSKTDFKPFIEYIEEWQDKNLKSVGFSQDGIVLKIGKIKKHFAASFNSDAQLLDIMHKNKQTIPIKLGVD